MKESLKPIPFVLFGATGNLAQTKILPALHSINHGRLRVIPVSRQSEVSIDVEKGTGYDTLASLIKDEPAIIYLSLAPQLHPKAITSLGKEGLLVRGVTKLLIEKPFGTDYATALELDRLIETYLDQTDVYRIDHYLGKEGLQKLMDQPISLVNARSINLRLLEEKGIGTRGPSYDAVGAFRDVGQNHLLEMLAVAFVGSSDRAALFKRLAPPSNTCAFFRRGQYQGYTTEKGVKPDSKTETAFHVMTSLDRIEIVLEAGKSMPHSESSIRVTYKEGTETYVDLSKGRDAYETILEAVLDGSRREFVSREEILELWYYSDRVVDCWTKVPLEIYGKEKPFLVQ